MPWKIFKDFLFVFSPSFILYQFFLYFILPSLSIFYTYISSHFWYFIPSPPSSFDMKFIKLPRIAAVLCRSSSKKKKSGMQPEMRDGLDDKSRMRKKRKEISNFQSTKFGRNLASHAHLFFSLRARSPYKPVNLAEKFHGSVFYMFLLFHDVIERERDI